LLVNDINSMILTQEYITLKANVTVQGLQDGISHLARADQGENCQCPPERKKHLRSNRRRTHHTQSPTVTAMASAAQDIAPRSLSRTVSNSLSSSASPTSTFHFPPSRSRKQLKPFATEDIKILLLENVNQTGWDILAQQGYQVEFLKSSLPEEQLIEKIRWGPIPLSIKAYAKLNPTDFTLPL
jgi:hypothetical protein